MTSQTGQKLFTLYIYIAQYLKKQRQLGNETWSVNRI